MKARVTRRWVAYNYSCCAVGYCDLQSLLRFQKARFYTAGIYGWNFDVYDFGDYAITTGYRDMIDNCTNSYTSDLAREYETKAGEIISNWSVPLEEQETKVNELLKDFLTKVFGEKRFYL